MSNEGGPYFNLKVVVQQTGIKPDTLRAWERRYGLPLPRRSGGGHRLYSRRDIGLVKWLMARQREGLSIKHSVELWRGLEAEGRDPLEIPVPVATSTPRASVVRATGDTLARQREEWITACLAYDEQRAEQLAIEAFALYPPEIVATELLQRAIAQIGEGWYAGMVTVQQEHFCSSLAMRRLEALFLTAPPPIRPGRILAACPPGEDHVLGLLLLTLLLRRRGWEVVYLGANVPVERLEAMVATARPKLAILAAQQLHTASTLQETGLLLQKEGVSMGYGGLIFNLLSDLQRRIPGHFLGEHLALAVETVESLMAAPQPPPKVDSASGVYLRAREHYLERRPMIEAEVVELLNSTDIGFRHLAIANEGLSKNIAAALELGDIDLLGVDIAWIEGLLSHRGMPSDILRRYLHIYYQAAKSQLDERAELLLGWLHGMAERPTGYTEEGL
jgi:DNA-binding transcriptional MerR regulator